MATSPASRVFTKSGVSRLESQGVSPVEGGGFTYQANLDQTLPQSGGLDDIMGELNEYLKMIDTAANDLIQRGRADAAGSLRTLSDRLKRSASTRGVNSEQIARQMADTTNQINSQQGLFESKVMQQKLSAITDAISKKASIAQASFSQDLQRFNAREGVLSRMENSSVISPTGGSVQYRRATTGETPKRQSPIVSSQSRSAVSLDQRAKLEQMGADFRNKNAIAKFQYEQGLYSPYGSGQVSANTAAGYALAQRNMGTTPGLFKSGMSASTSPATRIQPQQPQQPQNTALAPGYNATGGYTRPPDPNYVPSTGASLPWSPASNQSFIVGPSKTLKGARYVVNNGKRTLTASGR